MGYTIAGIVLVVLTIGLIASCWPAAIVTGLLAYGCFAVAHDAKIEQLQQRVLTDQTQISVLVNEGQYRKAINIYNRLERATKKNKIVFEKDPDLVYWIAVACRNSHRSRKYTESMNYCVANNAMITNDVAQKAVIEYSRNACKKGLCTKWKLKDMDSGCPDSLIFYPNGTLLLGSNTDISGWESYPVNSHCYAVQIYDNSFYWILEYDLFDGLYGNSDKGNVVRYELAEK